MLDSFAVVRALVAASGIATGVVFVGMGLSLRLPRFIWVGIIGGMLSAVIFALPVPIPASWVMMGAIWAIVLAISGGRAFQQALRNSGTPAHD